MHCKSWKYNFFLLFYSSLGVKKNLAIFPSQIYFRIGLLNCVKVILEILIGSGFKYNSANASMLPERISL
jgi:hypothetical protein